MADNGAPVEESPAQRQARLRREKRNAKITAQGSDRLAKITGLSGRPAPATENVLPAPSPAITARPKLMSASVDDPDEVDISDHAYTPQSRNALSWSSTPQQNPFAGMPGFGAPGAPGDADADPMMRMMQQMMAGGGGMGGDPNDPNGPMGELPPFMRAMMSGQQRTQEQQQNQPAPTSSTYMWRIIHAVFALGLALYIALTSTFNGSKLSRAQSVEGMDFGPKLFYIFATAELVLQSSRYFVEKGQLQGGGWLATIANTGLVPEPWGGYIRVAGRYSVIWQTIVGDAMTIVFVLGCLAWWRGMAAA